MSEREAAGQHWRFGASCLLPQRRHPRWASAKTEGESGVAHYDRVQKPQNTTFAPFSFHEEGQWHTEAVQVLDMNGGPGGTRTPDNTVMSGAF